MAPGRRMRMRMRMRMRVSKPTTGDLKFVPFRRGGRFW